MITRNSQFHRAWVLGVLLMLPAVAAQAAGADYYAQFGGAAGMRALVNAFVNRVVIDPRISAYFRRTNIPALKAALALQFCQLEGGNCKFSMSMHAVHAQLGVTQAAFNALANDLYLTMDRRAIPMAAQNNLLAKLAAMEPQVVTR
jgi:hemoglobin